ncbi:MAG: hypothetical protein P1U53_12330, partial [Sulfitobacter sp.]|nr:hypothetical protein [Sulfitobacter sp.]
MTHVTNNPLRDAVGSMVEAYFESLEQDRTRASLLQIAADLVQRAAYDGATHRCPVDTSRLLELAEHATVPVINAL